MPPSPPCSPSDLLRIIFVIDTREEIARADDFPNGPLPYLCFDSNPELLNPLLFGNMDREKILRFFSIETISCEFTRILQLSPLLEGNFLVISISLRNFYKELIVCRGCDYYTRAERRREGRRDEIARSNDEQEEGKMSNNWNKNNE